MNKVINNLLYAHFIVACQAENFVFVRSHQSRAINEHLESHLVGFDKEYEKNNGNLGSSEHLKERSVFIKSASESINNSLRSQHGYISKLNTKTKTYCPSLNKSIAIESQHNFSKKYMHDQKFFNFVLN